jgi:hypothetical protein
VVKEPCCGQDISREAVATWEMSRRSGGDSMIPKAPIADICNGFPTSWRVSEIGFPVLSGGLEGFVFAKNIAPATNTAQKRSLAEHQHRQPIKRKATAVEW